MRLFCTLLVYSASAFAYSAGAPAGSSGAPGEHTCAYSGCHAILPGSGSLSASFGSAPTYIPGVPQHIVITITDPTAARWGFQAAARVASNPRVTQAGNFEPTDANTQVICDDGSLKPAGQACAITPSFQYINQTSSGTQAYTTGTVRFEFDWTPPSPGVGNVTFYIAAEAANNDGTAAGDHIYTQTYTLTQTSVAIPVINNKGVVNAADSSASITPGGWTAIYGVNLASGTRTLVSTDIVDGVLPTQLAGVSVNIDNQPAYISYVSPTQINVLPAADPNTGMVRVQVNFGGQTSSAATVTQQAIFPSLFVLAGTNYVAAQHSDGTPIGPSTLFFPAAGSPAQPGETVVLYGSGFGQTNPAVTIGQFATVVSPLPGTNAFSATVNGVKAMVAYAGLSTGSVALYQFNIILPDTLGNGNYPVILQYLGKSTQTGVVIAVQP